MSAFTRLRLIGSSSIIVGILLLGASIWCITTLNGPSFAVDTFAGDRPTARDFVLLILEIALILGGAYSVIFGFITMLKSRKQLTFARSMHFVDVDFVADPKMSAPGRCWQCGSKVRAGNAICYACGAAQRRGRPAQTDALPERGSFPAPVSSGALPPIDPASPPGGAPVYLPPEGYQLGVPESSSSPDMPDMPDMPDAPPDDNAPGPRVLYPWR